MQNEAREKEKSFSSINLRSFLLVSGLLISILALAGILSYFIAQGSYSYTEDGKIILGTYVKGKVEGIAIWRVLTAPFRVFASEDSLTIIMISIFLLIMSGIFNVMEKTGGVKALITKITTSFADKKKTVILIIMLFFMLFGSFFGMFEELITLLPIIIAFTLSLGYDTMTGLGICMLASCFGFSAAITNPFSVGLASEYAGVAVQDGIWLRLMFFATVFCVLSCFILLHIKKISKNPQKSLSYEIDREKLASMSNSEGEEIDSKCYRTYAVFFLIQLVILVLIASVRAISGLAIPILAVSFLVGGLTCGLIVSSDKKKVFEDFGRGAAGMLPAVFMIAVASSVKLVLKESNIIDTIMHTVITALSGKSKFTAIILIYLLILFLQIFIGSASAKIVLIMPIIVPMCGALGISPSVVILTYCMADGFTDMILPTNPVLLIGLSMANVSYGKWIKWTFVLQIIMLALTVAVLGFAVGINYGI